MKTLLKLLTPIALCAFMAPISAIASETASVTVKVTFEGAAELPPTVSDVIRSVEFGRIEIPKVFTTCSLKSNGAIEGCTVLEVESVETGYVRILGAPNTLINVRSTTAELGGLVFKPKLLGLFSPPGSEDSSIETILDHTGATGITVSGDLEINPESSLNTNVMSELVSEITISYN